MLTVTNLKKSYGSHEVLKGISFKIEEGKIYGFLGQNGAGKSTTMNIITGLIDFNAGEIHLDGQLFNKNKTLLLKKVGYLPQNPVFYNYMTGYEYLEFIGTIAGMSPSDIKSRSTELLQMVGLEESAKRKVGGYSGGMKQRFGMAVSMFNRPRLLILDEPTSALDPEGRAEILELINKLKMEGITIFLSTHILNDVERICDDVSILHKGKIIVSDNLEVLKSKYIQPIYDVEFEKPCMDLSNIFAGVSWLEKVTVSKNNASFYIKDLKEAKHNLLPILTNHKNTIVSFNLRKSNLEDIFLRLVNKDGNF